MLCIKRLLRPTGLIPGQAKSPQNWRMILAVKYLAVKYSAALSICLATLLAGYLAAADEKPMFNGKNLDGWEVIGDGQWTVMQDGTLLGQRIGDYRKMLVPGGPLATPPAF